MADVDLRYGPASLFAENAYHHLSARSVPLAVIAGHCFVSFLGKANDN